MTLQIGANPYATDWGHIAGSVNLLNNSELCLRTRNHARTWPEPRTTVL